MKITKLATLFLTATLSLASGAALAADSGAQTNNGQANAAADAGQVAVVVLHCPSKLKTLVVFPSIFKGEHVKHTEMVEVLSGSEITVAFDRPTALQIDGETVTGVTEYSVATDAAKENAARQTMAG